MRRFEGDERNSKRQSTLTQIDFTKLLAPIDLSKDDAGEDKETGKADSGYDVQHGTGYEMDEGAKTPHPRSVKSKINVLKDEDLGPDVRKPTIPADILKTPKKFRGMEVVPSSQSPADSPLSTQRNDTTPVSQRSVKVPESFISPIKLYIQRSPLRERSTNIAIVSQNERRARESKATTAGTMKQNAKTRKSRVPRPDFVSSSAKMMMEDSDQEGHNIEPTEGEPCLYVGIKTQTMLHAVDITCKEYREGNKQNNSSPAEGDNKEESNELAMDADAKEENEAVKEEPQTFPVMFENEASEILLQVQENSSEIESADVPLSNHNDNQDSAAAQLLRETQAYNEHLSSFQDLEPTRIPSSQDREQEQDTPLPAAPIPATQRHSSHHRTKPSQATTIGTSPAPTPHRSERFLPSSPGKHSVVMIPSSPLPQRTTLQMPPPRPGSSPGLSRSAKRMRDLRNQLLEFDYEDDPVSVSQLLPESLVDGSIPMPPPFSSPTQNE